VILRMRQTEKDEMKPTRSHGEAGGSRLAEVTTAVPALCVSARGRWIAQHRRVLSGRPSRFLVPACLRHGADWRIVDAVKTPLDS
jgi:hypothetical protein